MDEDTYNALLTLVRDNTSRHGDFAFHVLRLPPGRYAGLPREESRVLDPESVYSGRADLARWLLPQLPSVKQ